MPRVKRLAALVVAVLAMQSGCNFAVKHPAATAAIVGGTMGFGTCAVIGGSTAAFLGLVTAVAMWTMGGEPDDHALVDPAMDNPEDGPADIKELPPPEPLPAAKLPEPVVEPAPPPSLPPPTPE
jgi:hypothetical protein